MINKRRGVISISREMIENAEHFEAMQLLFCNFVPLAIDNDSINWNGISKYYGLSDHFEEIEQRGTVIPEYTVEFESRKNGPITIKFIKLI